MKLTIESELESETGRWLAEVLELSGVMKYGSTRDDAIRQAKALALEVIASELKHGERTGDLASVEFVISSEPARAA